MSDGRSNSFFVRRIAAAAELYRAGRVQFLLLSGYDSRPDYDEPSEMRRALIDAGVPASRLVLDYAGFRTLDSVVLRQDVFGLRQVIIVSQHFHNERAVYLARAHGLEAFAFDAVGVGGPEGLLMAAGRLCRASLPCSTRGCFTLARASTDRPRRSVPAYCAPTANWLIFRPAPNASEMNCRDVEPVSGFGKGSNRLAKFWSSALDRFAEARGV